MPKVTHADVERELTYHSPLHTQLDALIAIRRAAREFGHVLVDSTPGGDAQRAAFDRLLECVLHAEAGVVLWNNVEDPPT